MEEIINNVAKDEGDIDSFFRGGQTTFIFGGFSGLDDFEVICFIQRAVKPLPSGGGYSETTGFFP